VGFFDSVYDSLLLQWNDNSEGHYFLSFPIRSLLDHSPLLTIVQTVWCEKIGLICGVYAVFLRNGGDIALHDAISHNRCN
jgi:hypothetical protein